MGAEMFILILLIAAFVLFLAASFGVLARINLVALGLACVTLTLIIPLAH